MLEGFICHLMTLLTFLLGLHFIVPMDHRLRQDLVRRLLQRDHPTVGSFVVLLGPMPERVAKNVQVE